MDTPYRLRAVTRGLHVQFDLRQLNALIGCSALSELDGSEVRFGRSCDLVGGATWSTFKTLVHWLVSLHMSRGGIADGMVD